MNLLIAWVPLSDYGRNLNGETEPRFLICTTAERCRKQAARWVLEDADKNLALMAEAGVAEIAQAVDDEDWGVVVEIYNKRSRSGWHIYMTAEEVDVFDWDPDMEGLGKGL